MTRRDSSLGLPSASSVEARAAGPRDSDALSSNPPIPMKTPTTPQNGLGGIPDRASRVPPARVPHPHQCNVAGQSAPPSSPAGDRCWGPPGAPSNARRSGSAAREGRPLSVSVTASADGSDTHPPPPWPVPRIRGSSRPSVRTSPSMMPRGCRTRGPSLPTGTLHGLVRPISNRFADLRFCFLRVPFGIRATGRMVSWSIQ